MKKQSLAELKEKYYKQTMADLKLNRFKGIAHVLRKSFNDLFDELYKKLIEEKK